MGVKVGRMTAGSCFGVASALQHNAKRHTVTCVTDCEMYTVDGRTLRLVARYVCWSKMDGGRWEGGNKIQMQLKFSRYCTRVWKR